MGKRVLVIGAARSGIASATFLAKQGNQVILTDMKQPNDVSALETLGVSFLWGMQPEIAALNPDYIVLSPGVPLTIPPVQYAKTHGIPVIGELELAYRNAKAPFIAITGTNGKTTTTTLTGELLKTTGKHVLVGGNIGTPLIGCVPDLNEDDIVVAEVSSFQLETVDMFSPHLALMINLTPDHLDRHGSLENYLACKANIFAHQKATDYLILNYDDEALRLQAAKSKGKVFFFSQQHILQEGVCLENGFVVLKLDGKTFSICQEKEIAIKGKHNLENAMGAVLLAYLSGVRIEDIRSVLTTFRGVEHRLEPVRVYHGVQYINDSKGTNPDATMKAIEAYQEPIVLILGGKNKGSDFTQLAFLVKERVKNVVVLGEAKPAIVAALEQVGFQSYIEVDTFAEAVQTTVRIAEPGDIVLLSPACASWDMFQSYEERGDLFKQLVQAL